MGCGNYDIPDHKRGDTFLELDFAISVGGQPVDLTGADAAIEFRLGSRTGPLGIRLENGSGLTISGNVVTIDQWDPTLDVGTYFWDLEIIDTAGIVTTYIGGQWRIRQDVTQ